jgi:hypothetical protein
MAAPVAAIVTLPDDSGNAGKKVRTQTRVVGANTVHEHGFFLVSQRNYTGSYYISSAVLAIQASAHVFGTSGFLWFHNPVASTVKVAISKLVVQTQLGSALVAVTSPRLLFSVCTITGTASGASLTGGKKDPTAATAQASCRTAITGLTLSAEKPWISALPVASATAVAYNPPSVLLWVADDDEDMIVLSPGECLNLYQADGGTASDTRRAVVTIEWKEYE